MLCLVVEEGSVFLVSDEIDSCFLAPLGFDLSFATRGRGPFLEGSIFLDFGIVHFMSRIDLSKYPIQYCLFCVDVSKYPI